MTNEDLTRAGRYVQQPTGYSAFIPDCAAKPLLFVKHVQSIMGEFA